MWHKSSEKKKIIGSIVVLLLFGIISAKVHAVAFLGGLLFFLIGMYITVRTSNKFGTAHLFAGFIVGAEVFFRMSWSGLPWEFGKYAVIFLLFSGLIVGNQKRKTSLLAVLYIVLLLPAFYLTLDYYDDLILIKKAFFFNMLGPIALAVSVLYFNELKMTKEEFKKLSRWVVLGVIPMSTLIFFVVGDYSSIEFGGGSSSEASGNFSGNQVSVAFGIGVLFLLVNMILQQTILYHKLIDTLFLGIFVFQGLMTFSRGGMMTTIVSVLLASIFYYFSNFQQLVDFLTKNIYKIVIGMIFLLGVFIYVNDITGGALYGRYFNEKKDGSVAKKDYTTGRADIAKGDLFLFTDSDGVGVGIGVSKLERPNHKNFAAHIEYTRMLAEHGILGLISLIMLLIMPLKRFFEVLHKPDNLLILITMSMWAMVTMTHAATRQGAVGFIFGIAFIHLISQNIKKEQA